VSGRFHSANLATSRPQGSNLTIVVERSLRAVLVDRATPRITELLASALDGSGPAILPIDASLPDAQLDALLGTFAPDQIEDAGGITTVRSARNAGIGDTAVIVGTSGSTGQPKGVLLSADALLSSARASMARVGAQRGERWLCCLPVTHIAGIQVLVRALLSGVEPVLANRADAAVIAASGAAHISLVPTQLQRLGVGMPALNAFKSVLLGGAAAAGSLVEQARAAGVPVVTTYGMSETCGGCVYDGVPLEGVRVAIRDEAGAPAGPGASGRIWISGPVLFGGYFGGAGVPADGWFRTGDLGRLDESGRLSIRGRADDVINTGGHKVVPGEVAAALQDYPGVRDVAVVGQKDPEWGERVVAVIVAADPADPPTLKMLRMHVKQRLPRYAAPSRVVVVDAVPLLPGGKQDLARLRQDLTELGNTTGREQTEPSSVTN
jgi:O-succinylbenzoic acid--CoA ligase